MSTAESRGDTRICLSCLSMNARLYNWDDLYGQETRGAICERKDYRIFRQKMVNIHIAFGDILRHRLVYDVTSLHLRQSA